MDDPIKGWDLPIDSDLAVVFAWCLKERAVDRLLLTGRLGRGSKSEAAQKAEMEDLVTSLFGDKVLERKMARKWPGTELLQSRALVYRIRFDESLLQPMSEMGGRLSDWWEGDPPRLPGDPCLYREGDPWPVLVSVIHERDAWILSPNRPPFCSKEPFEFRPENLMVPTAAEGFIGR
jgi:hypothetical protein